MFQLHLEAQVINPEKGIVKSKAWISKSYVKNILGSLAAQFDTANSYDVVDTGANTRSLNETSGVLYCPMCYGGGFVYGYGGGEEYKGDEIGIQVGNGNAANTALTYTLHQQIVHGSGSGQLEHFGGCLDDVVTVSGSDIYYDIERIFRNSSGGTITVKEYAIVILRNRYINNHYPVLIVRDVFTDPGDWVDVANVEFLKVTYRPIVTV